MREGKHEFIRLLRRVNTAVNLRLPLLILITGMWLPLLLLAGIALAGICLPHQTMFTLLLVFTGVSIPSAFLTAFFIRQNLRRTAALIDRKWATRNQLEAAVELQDNDHPLRDAQFADACRCLVGRNRQDIARLLSPTPLYMVICGLLMTATAILALFISTCMNQPPVKPLDFSHRKGKLTENEEFYAELSITIPAQTTTLTPLDIVEWEGTAVSTHGFQSLSCEIFLNGEHKKSIAIPTASMPKGKAYPAGDFSIEETGAEPYNIMSFHLQGISSRGTDKLEVVSKPCFIQIKPLKEDIFVIDGNMQAKFSRYAEAMKHLLRQEIQLNEMLFMARMSQEKDSTTVYKMYNELATEQRKLRETLSKMLENSINADNPEISLSPNMLKSLESARDNMQAAEKKIQEAALKGDKGVMKEAGEHQQKAIADILNSLKELKKFFNRNNKEAQSPQAEKSTDKNHVENPGKLLEKAIGQEEKIVKGGKEAGFKLEAVKQPQSEVSWALKLLKEKSDLPEEATMEITLAADHSMKTENAINSNAENAFRVSSAKALDHMRQALDELRRKSSDQTDDAIKDARKDIAEMQRETESKQDARQQQQETLKKVADKLQAEADRQQRKGIQSNADTLETLAKDVREKANNIPKMKSQQANEAVEEAKKKLTQARLQDPGSSEELNKKFGELRRWISYLEQHADSVDEKEIRDMLLEMELSIDDLRTFLNNQNSTPDMEKLRQMATRADTALKQVWKQQQGRIFTDRIAPALAPVKAELEGMIKTLEACGKRMDVPSIQQFTPDRIPAEYRDLTAQYFEKLSRLRNKGKQEKK